MRRPDGVTAIAVWYFINAAFLLLGACALIAVLAGILAAIGNDPEAQFWTSFGMLTGVVFSVAFGIALVLAGWGLLQLRSWARWLAFILAIFSLFAFPIGTIIGALIIWYLLKDDVRDAFEIAEGNIPAEVVAPEEEIPPP
jgi:uncharacterized Tic20 family protein